MKSILGSAFASDVWRLLLDLVVPVRCAVCLQERELALCEGCIQKFELLGEQFCIVCGTVSPGGFTHQACTQARTPERLICLYRYAEQGLSRAIVAGKYHFVKDVFCALGRKAAQHLRSDLASFTSFGQVLFCPVPLHPFRKRWRGYNQTQILAEQLADSLGASLPADLLSRIKFTKVQKDLRKDERRANVSGCFALASGADVSGRNIFLIDDVATTGYTLLEASRVLKAAGAGQIWCLALARDL